MRSQWAVIAFLCWLLAMSTFAISICYQPTTTLLPHDLLTILQ